MQIKKLTIDDYDHILSIWQRAGLSHRPQGRDSYESIAEQMNRTHVAFLGAFEEDQLVGVGLVTHDGRKGWINRIAVDPEFQRQGIAKAIIQASEELLNDWGISIYACLIEEDNEGSLDLFRSVGYVLHTHILYLTKRKHDEV